MSSVTSWLSIGAVVIVVLFCINAVIYRLRFGTFLRRTNASDPSLKRSLTKSEVASAIFICVALLLAVGAPVVAPASALATWLREPYALLVFAVWCWLIAMLIGIGPRVVELLRGRRDA